MTTVNRVLGVGCSSCNEFLCTPILTSNCVHHFHQKCFEALSEKGNQCPICKHTITKGSANPYLEVLLDKLDTIGKTVLSRHSNQPFPDRMFRQAIKDGEIEVVRFYLNQGTSPKGLLEGITPLYQACELGNLAIAKLLLERGADVSQKNDLSYQSRYDKYWSINDFKGMHDADPMKGVLESNNVELVELLIQHGAKFDDVGQFHRTPLMQAIHEGKEELALLFIAKGANIIRADVFRTPIMISAINRGLLGVVKELLRRGMDMNCTCSDGRNPIYVAARTENPEMLRIVLQNSEHWKINSLWHDKWTPLSSAIEGGYFENVKMLVEAGADLTIKYNDLNILELAENRLSESEEFYRTNPTAKEEGERLLPIRQSIVEYLKKVTTDNRFAKEDSVIRSSAEIDEVLLENLREVPVVTFSDGTQMAEPMFKTILMHLNQAMMSVGGFAAPYFLSDLKEFAAGKTLCVNPFYDAIAVMKAEMLIANDGEIYPDVRIIVDHCIVGKGENTKIKLPEAWAP